MVKEHKSGCLCDGCCQTREHWRGMGMALPAVVREQAAQALRARTEILSDADLRATWAPTMAEVAFWEESGRPRRLRRTQ